MVGVGYEGNTDRFGFWAGIFSDSFSATGLILLNITGYPRRTRPYYLFIPIRVGNKTGISCLGP